MKGYESKRGLLGNDISILYIFDESYILSDIVFSLMYVCILILLCIVSLLTRLYAKLILCK